MWIVRIVIIAAIVAIRLIGRIGQIGPIDEIWLVAGWVIGMMLAEADHLFYVAVCNPQELTCQRVRHEILENRNWRNAWGILQSTKGERTRLPIHNILTGLVVAVLGLWVVGSVGSALASGVVMGLGIRLFTDFYSGNKKDWFWIFAREFDIREIGVVGVVWGALLLISLVGLIK